MKNFFYIFLTLIFTISCTSQKQLKTNVLSFEYSAVKRGLNEKLIVENKVFWTNKNPKKQDINTADWKILMKAFSELNLEQIPQLEAPTQKRFYDGAAITNLKIKYKNKIYETKGFDQGFPPAEIAPFINILLSITNKTK